MDVIFIVMFYSQHIPTGTCSFFIFFMLYTSFLYQDTSASKCVCAKLPVWN